MHPRPSLARVAALALALAACGGPRRRAVPRDPVSPPPQGLQEHTERDRVTGEVVHRWRVRYDASGRAFKDGAEERFWPDGTPRALHHWDAGEPVGAWDSWWPDGSLRSHHEYGVGPMVMRFHHEGGALECEGLAEDGVKQGPWVYYYPDGTRAQEGAYADGSKTGVWTLYHPDGSLWSRGRFHEDQRVGEWRHWGVEEPETESDWQPPPWDPDDARRRREAKDRPAVRDLDAEGAPDAADGEPSTSIPDGTTSDGQTPASPDDDAR